MTRWADLFGAWEDNADRMPLFVGSEKRMTVEEARDNSVEFALGVLQGYRSPSEHDDLHNPVEDLLQSMLMELYVRDNRTARVIERALGPYLGEYPRTIEYRVPEEVCEFRSQNEVWPFFQRCENESVTVIDVATQVAGSGRMSVCQGHWTGYLRNKVIEDSNHASTIWEL